MTTLKKGEGIGKEFSPTRHIGMKSRANRIKEINKLSAVSLERLQKKYGDPNPHKRRYVVDSKLNLVSID